MVSREFVARLCVLESELGGIENGRRYSDDDLCPSRICRISAYFGTEAKYSECDRYTVDTYWAY